jgi:hypothetical protein
MLLLVPKHASVLICNCNLEEIVSFCRYAEWKSNNQYRIKVNFERDLNFYHN